MVTSLSHKCLTIVSVDHKDMQIFKSEIFAIRLLQSFPDRRAARGLAMRKSPAGIRRWLGYETALACAIWALRPPGLMGPRDAVTSFYTEFFQGRTFGAPGLTAMAVSSEDGREQLRGKERPG